MERSVELFLSVGRSLRLRRDTLDLALRPDRTEAASFLAVSFGVSPLDRIAELLGLSVLPLPGILDRRERNDRVESLVSDLLKEGYDWSGASTALAEPLDPEPLDPEPPLSLEFWLPIVPSAESPCHSSATIVSNVAWWRGSLEGAQRPTSCYKHPQVVVNNRWLHVYVLGRME